MHPLSQRAYDKASTAIAAARSVEELKAVTASAHQENDRLFDEGMIHTRAAIACQAGCCYCCYLKVDAQPAEVFLVADYIRKHFSKEERQEVLAKADENRRKIEPLTAAQHMGANIPCALLREGRCSVYSARPGLCRAFHAQRVQTCKDSFEQPHRLDLPHSQIPQIQMALSLARNGVEQAYADAGYDSRPYDLNSALHEALSKEQPESRWRDKKSAFAHTALAKDYAGRTRKEANQMPEPTAMAVTIRADARFAPATGAADL